ncbi:hypothetical protein MSPP1_000542 [Malassezia sp. CBS 17886]|nr:hypothetical protein MSPP1_000542 [Malassezia sp. CBS 17886]
MTVVQFVRELLWPQPKSCALADVIDVSQPSLWVAVASIVFNPLFWNIVAQNEYRHKTITHFLGGRRYVGCYLLAVTIFTLGIVRDHLYQTALVHQPTCPLLEHPAFRALAAALFVAGSVLVVSSMYALGVTGTYLGDYFGILMDHIVTSFPFNVTGNPMYWGSSANFVAVALWYAKPAGLVLSVLVVFVYAVALRFEEPFTANIYRDAEAAKTNAAVYSEVRDQGASSSRAYGTRSQARTRT